MTIATMGRRIKKSAITVIPCRAWSRLLWLSWPPACWAAWAAAAWAISAAVLGCTGRAFAHLLQALSHNALARPSTLPAINTFSPIVSPTLTARCVALVSAAPMTQAKVLPCSSATARSGTRMLSGRTPMIHFDPAEHAGTKILSRIRKLGPDTQGAGLDVHRAVNEDKLAAGGMNRAVGQGAPCSDPRPSCRFGALPLQP